MSAPISPGDFNSASASGSAATAAMRTGLRAGAAIRPVEIMHMAMGARILEDRAEHVVGVEIGEADCRR